jgi:hypothetical protein
MDDSRTFFAADSGKCLAMIEQGIDQSVVAMTRPRMDHHSGRLIDYDQIGILKKNLERNVLGLMVDLFQRRLDQIDLVARSNDIPWTRRFAVEFNEPRPNQLLDAGT